MAFGFPAYAVGSRNFSLEKSLTVSAVTDALEVLKWRCESVSADQVVAKIRVNIFSWGEKLTVSVAKDGTVTARSEGVIPTQCIDWGKNERNVERFFGELDRSVTTIRSSVAALSPVRQFDEENRTPIERVFSDTDEKS
jgi:hypothetical protein